jgi:putative Mg2+ transporter-C (MgtC) family protein
MIEASAPSLAVAGWPQIGYVLLGFVLASLIGLEREFRHKSAGLRTQAIVGTSAALLMIVSKYGFMDVLTSGLVQVDPSRVAAQIVSGIGFLGAGLILTRGGSVRGLTTAAAVWESAAIGMAAGAGLWVFAILVTALHFVITFVYSYITRLIPGADATALQLEVVYQDGQGVLRQILAAITDQGWRVTQLTPRDHAGKDGEVAVAVDATGPTAADTLVSQLGSLDGVRGVHTLSSEELG